MTVLLDSIPSKWKRIMKRHKIGHLSSSRLVPVILGNFDLSRSEQFPKFERDLSSSEQFPKSGTAQIGQIPTSSSRSPLYIGGTGNGWAGSK